MRTAEEFNRQWVTQWEMSHLTIEQAREFGANPTPYGEQAIAMWRDRLVTKQRRNYDAGRQEVIDEAGEIYRHIRAALEVI